jgi:hypothetical protein
MDLAFDLTGKSPRVVKEMTTDFVAEFNRIINKTRGVRFSALAGNPLPTMCKSIVPNDGFVSVPSAHGTVSDRGESSSIHTDLTSTKDFSDFVKPRLAIGPKGNHMPDFQMPGSAVLFPRRERNYGAGYQPVSFAQVFGLPDPAQTRPFARDLRLPAGQSTEIDIPVDAAANFGITFMSDPKVSATLSDASGTSAGKNLTGSPEARGWFRSIFVNRPVTAGTWKLRLENTGTAESRVVLVTWVAN